MSTTTQVTALADRIADEFNTVRNEIPDNPIGGNATILNIVSLTAAAYAVLTPKVATTLYVVVG